MEFIRFMFSGFWIWLGCMMLIALGVQLISVIYRIPWRHLNIRKHGWPPSHCDADGDLKKEKETEDKMV